MAVGTDNLIASTTDPSGGASAWHYVYAGEGPWPDTDNWPIEFISGRQIQGISCPTSGLCVAVSGKRTDNGKIFTTNDPTGPASAWSEFELGGEFEFRSVSCPSASLCAAVDNKGRIVASTDPTGGPTAWHLVGSPGGGGALSSVTCLSAPFCLSGNQSGNLLTSTDPTAGAGSWNEVNGGGSVQITGVTCAATSQCLAVDDNGDVITSTDPTGGAGAWRFANVQAFTSQEGNGLFAASCPSSSLCALVGSRGTILTSEDPFVADNPSATRSASHARRRVRRPRARIATLEAPSERQLEHHRGKVYVRFYARAETRGFLCRLDRHHFRPCHSPTHYHVGDGEHVFRVRAIGYSGLRGPVASERFTVGPVCEVRRHKIRPCPHGQSPVRFHPAWSVRSGGPTRR